MTKYFDVAETSKIIRKKLKNLFPNTKFSVTSKRYAGGSSISVKWQDGAAYTEVESEIAIFEGKSFDTSSDLESNITVEYEGEKVCFPHYLNLNRSTSREFVERVNAYCQERLTYANQLKIVGSPTNSRFDVDSYYNFQNVMVEANQILNESAIDRVFNWAEEKLKIEGNEQLQQEIIDKQVAKDLEYLSLQPIESKYTEAIDTEINGYKVIDAKVKFQSGEVYHFVDGVLQYGIYGEFADIPIPAYEDRPVITLLIAECLETGRKIEWTWMEYQNLVDPVKPISITSTDIKIKAKFASSNEHNDIARYYKECDLPIYDAEYGCSNWTMRDCYVEEKIELSLDHYDRFVCNLLNHYDFLKGKGGYYSDCEDLPQDKDFCDFTQEERQLFYDTISVQCVAIVSKGRPTILVNPEKRPHSTYVGLIDNAELIEINSSQLTVPSQKSSVINLEEYREEKQTQLDLISLYKSWVESLIHHNRLTEIVDYQEWVAVHGNSICENEYKQFVDRCLAENSLNKIVSFEDWKVKFIS